MKYKTGFKVDSSLYIIVASLAGFLSTACGPHAPSVSKLAAAASGANSTGLINIQRSQDGSRESTSQSNLTNEDNHFVETHFLTTEDFSLLNNGRDIGDVHALEFQLVQNRPGYRVVLGPNEIGSLRNGNEISMTRSGLSPNIVNREPKVLVVLNRSNHNDIPSRELLPRAKILILPVAGTQIRPRTITMSFSASSDPAAETREHLFDDVQCIYIYFVERSSVTAQ